MGKAVTFLFIFCLYSIVTVGQEQLITICQDDAYPLQKPLRHFIAKQKNEIKLKPGLRLLDVIIRNGTFDSLQVSPVEDYRYYITPKTAGEVVIVTVYTFRENGKNVVSTKTSAFQAIEPPLVEAKLLQDNFAQKQTIEFALLDKRTGKHLSNRYRIGRYFDVEVYDELGKLVDRAPMQSVTVISLAPFPDPVNVKAGYTIKFTFPIRDFKTGILFSSKEVVYKL
ncbi:hypothetical protein [Rufibacter psychrotolerans]|uniref:hypothetical protein n=1 Tax=Rufibacter psychrotolerans TaxID=2812556 RepID=UPI001967086E|nr:hypothetical protein [Rufibacter sp. SYSU D00308]